MARKLLVLTVVLFAGVPAVAWGHGDVRSTDPKRNDVLRAPPNQVSVTLTEAPTEDAVMRVVDGCHTQVAEAVAVGGDTITAELADSEPGHYQVRWNAISSVDGHPTQGRFFFHVTGRAKCSEGDKGGGGDNSGSDSAAPGDDSVAPPPNDEESTSFPYIPAGLGLAAVIGVALIARRAGTR